ncbi:MAG: hypothetical protein CL524_08440 [Aequorivita sp.]|nr:hypothetical protein [Aequorivita sp.]MBF30718.1 hypothetical protein [Aequorivita sp.]
MLYETSILSFTNPESRIPNPESRIPNPKSQIPNPKSQIPNLFVPMILLKLQRHWLKLPLQHCLLL